jgi:hypothetical protein
MELQKNLSLFNSAFGPIIGLAVSAMFLICVGVFSMVFKMELTLLNEVLCLSYGFPILMRFVVSRSCICRAFQVTFYLRGTIVCTIYSVLNDTGQSLKQRLDLDTRLMNSLGHLDPQLRSEVEFFQSSLDGLCIAAGSYFSCTHSLVLSLYGFLLTYIALLVQSL